MPNNKAHATNVATANNSTILNSNLQAIAATATSYKTNLLITAAAARKAHAQFLLLQRSVINTIVTKQNASAARKANINNSTAKSASTASKYMYNCKSMQALANYAVANSLTQQQVAIAFINAYAAQNVTNMQFIAARILVYTALAVNKFKVVAITAVTATV